MASRDPECRGEDGCHHRAHVHSSEGSTTPGCRCIGCGCTRTAAEVVAAQS